MFTRLFKIMNNSVTQQSQGFNSNPYMNTEKKKLWTGFFLLEIYFLIKTFVWLKKKLYLCGWWTAIVNSEKQSYLPVQKYSFEILQIQKYPVFQFQISDRWKKKNNNKTPHIINNKISSKRIIYVLFLTKVSALAWKWPSFKKKWFEAHMQTIYTTE